MGCGRLELGAIVAVAAIVACGGKGRSDDVGDEGQGVLTLSGGGSTGNDDGQDGNDGPDVKLDVGIGNDGGGGPGDCSGGGMMGGELEFSYIWIANSSQGTVSKIDTFTGTEIARYATGPATQEEPSRTSVNLYGDVAVSNRGSQFGGAGGITKIVARLEDCVDANGNGSIETSSGPNDVLPWGSDECVVWNTPVPSTQYSHGPRPTAWEGSVSSNGCASPSPRLWMGWYDQPANTGRFQRLDSATGMVIDQVDVQWNGLNFGPYGGAVDKDGDFWVVGWQLGPLIEIDGQTLEVRRHEMPSPPADDQWSYGMSLDQYGNPWIASGGAAATFDVQTQQWSFVSTGNLSMRGVMVDAEDRAWFAVDATGTLGCGVGVVDVSTKQIVSPAIQLPGCSIPVGISIDIEGYVWVVDQGANTAFKIDPDTYQVLLSVPGLSAPYTYSDMTGAGLNLVVNPPAG